MTTRLYPVFDSFCLTVRIFPDSSFIDRYFISSQRLFTSTIHTQSRDRANCAANGIQFRTVEELFPPSLSYISLFLVPAIIKGKKLSIKYLIILIRYVNYRLEKHKSACLSKVTPCKRVEFAAHALSFRVFLLYFCVGGNCTLLCGAVARRVLFAITCD